MPGLRRLRSLFMTIGAAFLLFGAGLFFIQRRLAKKLAV